MIANAVEAFASSIRFDTRKLFSSVWNVQTNDNSIAFVTSFPNSWWGGCEDLWCATATLLANEGSFKVFASVNSYSRLPQPLVQLQSAGCKLSQKQHSRFSGPFGSYEKRWLKARKPKLVVVSEGETFEGRLWMNACRELGIRFVTLSHASSSWSWPFDGSNESLRQNYLAAEHCFFVCRENLELLEMKIASKLACASVVRNPFRVPYQSTLKWPDSGGKLRLACVATSEPHRKGQDLLFRVLAKPKWQERSLEVTLYCGGGDREALLRQMAHALKLKNVEFVGWVDEVASIWRDNHGLLLPSRREGLPLVAIEAMLCGRVCILTDVGGNSEIIEDGRNGFLALAATEGQIDHALERAWRKREDWESIGKAAAEGIRRLVPPNPAEVFATKVLAFLKPISAQYQ